MALIDAGKANLSLRYLDLDEDHILNKMNTVHKLLWTNK